MQTKHRRDAAAELHAAVRQKNIPGLDAMRAAAIILVILYHFGEPVASALGVIVFFVLSGFLITGVLLKEIAKSGTISIRTFYSRRAYRIFPAYYLCWFLTMGLALWKREPVTWGNALGTFFYLADYGRAFLSLQQQYHYQMGISWSLAVEEQFYLLWPLLLLYVCKRSRPLQVIGWIIAGLWAWRILLVVIFHVSWDYAYNAFDTRADALMIGCWLAFAVYQSKIIKPVLCWLSSQWLLLVPILLLEAINALEMHNRINPSMQVVEFMADPLLTAILLLQLIYWGSQRWSFLEHPAIKFIARISYSLYLYHQGVHVLLREYVDGIPHGRTAIMLAASLLVATTSYYGIERPFIRMRDRGKRPSVLLDDGEKIAS